MMKKSMKQTWVLLAAALILAAGGMVQAQQAAQNFTGDGGKGMSLTVLAPTASGLAEYQNYLPALVQGEFVSNFSGYSAISVLDRERADALIAEVVGSESYSDAEREKMASQIGNRIPTTHFMGGKITKTATGYALQMQITKTDDKTTAASYSGTFTFAELDDLTGIRRASLDLLQKTGVALTETAQAELAGAATENRVSAQTALAKGVTAQRERSEVAALSYYLQAAAFDPSLKEASNRSSKLNSEISSGSMGDNIRNDIQWRKDWIARLTETEQFFSKLESMPYTLYYSEEINQGKVNYQTETVDLSINTVIMVDVRWVRPLERALQAVYGGLNATKRSGEWQLSNWPKQGVTNLNAFAKRKQRFSVVFELLNNQNKVIGSQALVTGGYYSWLFGGVRPIVFVPAHKSNTVNFQNVNANDITDKMTIRVASVNGNAAKNAAKNVGLQIRTFTNTESILIKGTVKDTRDGKNYSTVEIGSQTWMAQNLDYQTSNSKCYNYNASNCAKYGRLYNWNDAMNACPAGWHLPIVAEWEVLGHSVGGMKTAGKMLKSKIGWNKNGNGTDEFGFSALPGGGYFLGSFNTERAGNRGYWWSATENRDSEASYRGMTYASEDVYWGTTKSALFSVRCVQGENVVQTKEEQAMAVWKELQELEKAERAELKELAAAAAQGSFTDKRDKNTYKTVKIGEQTWMAQNLNYKTANSKCYGNKDANCQKYGRLYTWSDAKSACPAGWHLPTGGEWTTLDNRVHGTEVGAGTRLKAKSGWDYDGNGNDEYHFSALPGGYGGASGNFGEAGNVGYWWSAKEGSASEARFWYISGKDVFLRDVYGNKAGLLSVRCVAD